MQLFVMLGAHCFAVLHGHAGAALALPHAGATHHTAGLLGVYWQGNCGNRRGNGDY
jgi:hypothetical protein